MATSLFVAAVAVATSRREAAPAVLARHKTAQEPQQGCASWCAAKQLSQAAAGEADSVCEWEACSGCAGCSERAVSAGGQSAAQEWNSNSTSPEWQSELSVKKPWASSGKGGKA